MNFLCRQWLILCFHQFVSEEFKAILDEGDYLLLMGYSVLEATSKCLFATEPKPSVSEAPLFVSAARTWPGISHSSFFS